MISFVSWFLSIVPRPLHRLALRLAYPLRAVYRRRHRPAGCALIIQDNRGHILLVRHSYVEPQTWMLPAGGMKWREAPLPAAERELQEEVNCLLSDAKLVEFEDAEYWGRNHKNFIVGGFTDRVPKPDSREIDEAAFFSLNELPEETSEPTLIRLERWQKRNSFPIPVPAFVRVEYVEAKYGKGRANPIAWNR